MPTTGFFLNQYFTTTLNVGGGIDNSQTTGIIISDVTGIDTAKPGVMLINYADPLNTAIAEWVTYTSIDGSKELQGVVRGAEGYSAKSHDNSVSVAFPLSESHINNLATALSIGGVFTNIVTKTINLESQSSAPTTELVTKNYIDSSATPPSLYDNLLKNGNMDISQRASTFVSGANNDDVYTLDMWNLLSDGNDILDVSQDAVTDLTGSSYAIKLDVETAKRGGIIQFIESKDAIKFRGQTVSLSFKVKSANISAIRAGVLSWDGTADAITSDVVGTWGANPTPVANWTLENTPADLAVTSSWTTVTIEGISLDTSGMNNLAVFIWTPNEETIGDIVYVSQVKLNQGSVATTFTPRSYDEELFACQRYCYVPATPGTGSFIGFGMCVSNALARILVHFPNTMRTLPTLTATAGDYQIDDSAAATDVTGINNTDESTWNTTRVNNLRISVSGTPFTDKRPCSLKCDGTANRVMIFSADL